MEEPNSAEVPISPLDLLADIFSNNPNLLNLPKLFEISPRHESYKTFGWLSPLTSASGTNLLTIVFGPYFQPEIVSATDNPTVIRPLEVRMNGPEDIRNLTMRLQWFGQQLDISLKPNPDELDIQSENAFVYEGLFPGHPEGVHNQQFSNFLENGLRVTEINGKPIMDSHQIQTTI